MMEMMLSGIKIHMGRIGVEMLMYKIHITKRAIYVGLKLQPDKFDPCEERGL